MKDLKAVFDDDYYCRSNPDVARASVEPFQHYLAFGRLEGRWPARFTSVSLAAELWQNDSAHEQLARDVARNDKSKALHEQADAQLGRWFLAQYYGAKNQWRSVVDLLSPLQHADGLELLRALVPHQGPFLCLLQALLRTGRQSEAERLVQIEHWPIVDDLGRHDHYLAESMVVAKEQRFAAINQIYEAVNLAPLSGPCEGESLFDGLTATGRLKRPGFWQRQPKVSVIVPCYNCATTLTTAVKSLQQQSWQRLQIILVNDASMDNTAEVMTELAKLDKRISVVHLHSNEGAYGARNAGLDVAKGQFITTHDADDWSHPDKIACQVYDLLKHPKAVANRSAWVRADDRLNFSRWRPEASWIYPNVSSLMYRRRVFKRLGYWDAVRADGDTEFYYRVLAEFGTDSVREVMPAVPLAFGRVDQRSLTQSDATHVSSMLGGVRRRYQQAAAEWHRQASSRQLARYPKRRPFVAPLSLSRGTDEAWQANAVEHLDRSTLFDATYYLQRYPDVAQAGIEPALHYLKFGAAEGRDPCARFSSSGYRYVHRLSLNENPLVHCLTKQELHSVPTTDADDVTASLTLGALATASQRPTLMVIAHSTAGEAFGAEKSLLDVLAMLQPHYQLWVVLPGALNADYVAKVQRLSQCISFLPLRWWHASRATDDEVLQQLRLWMRSVQQVYVNTLTLHEPLLAAELEQRRCIVHVRELPEHDATLCQTLGASADAIREHLLDNADVLIANSACVAAELKAPERTTIVPNVIEPEQFVSAQTDFPQYASERPLRVGMLSSNLAKKGIKDFYQLASTLYNDANFEWHLFGPLTEDLSQVQQQYPEANVVVNGYVDDPVQALKQLDVVVNLSHFQESFGRSVLEGLAAGKVVIAYDWGALSELLRDDAGVLVPFGDINALALQLTSLITHPQRLVQLREQALHRARQFSVDAVKPRLLEVLHS